MTAEQIESFINKHYAFLFDSIDDIKERKSCPSELLGLHEPENLKHCLGSSQDESMRFYKPIMGMLKTPTPVIDHTGYDSVVIRTIIGWYSGNSITKNYPLGCVVLGSLIHQVLLAAFKVAPEYEELTFKRISKEGAPVYVRALENHAGFEIVLAGKIKLDK